MPKKRMPGILRFLIGFLVTILIIVVLLVSALYICFFDNGHKNVNVRGDYDNAEVFNEVLVDSLDDTKTTKKMRIAITEDQINQLLYNAFKDKTEINEYVKNIYVEAKDGQYDFVFEANAKNIFLTRMILHAHLQVTNEQLAFKVDDVKLGRISGIQNMLGIIEKFIPIPDLDSALQSSGLKLHFDIHNLIISYNLNDFYDDLINLMGGESDYTTIFHELIAKEYLRTIGAFDENFFEIDINIDQLQLTDATHGITGYTVQDGYFNEAIDKTRTNVISLLNSGEIKEADTDIVSRYFIGENALLDTSEQNIIATYKDAGVFTSYASEIPYYDYEGDSSENLKQVAAEQILPQNPLVNDHVEVVFDSAMIDDMFKTSTALGKINTFVRNQGTNSVKDYKLNFVVVDRISTLIKNNSAYFVLSLNFNGYSGQMTLKTTKIDDPSLGFGVMHLRIDDMYLGNEKVSENTKEKFLDIVSSALTSGAFDDRFTVNGNIFQLDLKKTLDENGVLESIGYSTTFYLEDLNAPGAIKVCADR